MILTCHIDTYQVLFNNVCNSFLLIILGSINTLTCTKYIWCSYRSLVVTLASEVVFLKMSSRIQRKRSKQRAEYLQKQDKNKAKAIALYKADPEKKKAFVRDSYKADPEKMKASVRDSYKADPEKKKASVRDSYNADIESKRSAKRQRYEEDFEENRAAKRRRYEEDLEGNRAAKRQKCEDNSAAIKACHLKEVGIGMTPLSDWINVLPSGRGTAGVTELPLPPKGMLWHVVLTLKSCACNICRA